MIGLWRGHCFPTTDVFSHCHKTVNHAQNPSTVNVEMYKHHPPERARFMACWEKPTTERNSGLPIHREEQFCPGRCHGVTGPPKDADTWVVVIAIWWFP